jgi:hypothetical protein
MEHAGDILRRFWRNPEYQRVLRLVALWDSWSEIVGPEVAELARPLGHNKTTLLLGVEDAVAMQEISFQTPDILRMVNASLGESVFDKVRLDLIGGRTSLDTIAASFPKRPGTSPLLSARNRLPPPVNLGALQDDFSKIPAVERCYKAYVRHYGQSHEHTSKQLQHRQET